MLAHRKKHPQISPSPMAVNPHIFKKSTAVTKDGLATIASAHPEKTHFDSIRNAAEVK
jgi:hypothetical protein